LNAGAKVVDAQDVASEQATSVLSQKIATIRNRAPGWQVSAQEKIEEQEVGGISVLDPSSAATASVCYLAMFTDCKSPKINVYLSRSRKFLLQDLKELPYPCICPYLIAPCSEEVLCDLDFFINSHAATMPVNFGKRRGQAFLSDH